MGTVPKELENFIVAAPLCRGSNPVRLLLKVVYKLTMISIAHDHKKWVWGGVVVASVYVVVGVVPFGDMACSFGLSELVG